jgi:hypothetical protein
VPETGAPVFLGSETRPWDLMLGSFYFVVAAAASPGESETDMCWAGLREYDFPDDEYRTHISGWDSTGLVRSFTVDGLIYSMHAVSPDDLWLTIPVLDAEVSGIRRHMEWDGLAWSEEDFAEPKAGLFVAPEASSNPF